jgi:predicted Zn-dependent protease
MNSATDNPMLARLEALLEKGPDATVLRFGLANGYLEAGAFDNAIAHARGALALDPGYSAAWKILGRALASSGAKEAALEAWQEGIAAAEARGDMQAVREMQVFVKRLTRELAQD